MASDYLNFLTEQLNIDVEIVSNIPWPEVLKRTRQKEIDVIPCAAKSAERETYLSFSEPYLSFPFVIVGRKDGPFIGGIDDLEGKKISFVEKVITQDWLKQDGITIIPHVVNSPLEALKAVSIGDADAYIGNLAAITYAIEKNGLANLKIAAPTKYGNYNLHFAVRKDWPQLVSIVNKGLASMTPEQKAKIRNKWLASIRYEHGISKIDILMWVLGVTCIAAMIITWILFWNRKLNREITERKLAEQENEKLIEALKKALEDIKQLSGLLPICSNCKKIRDDKGYWNQIEGYIKAHSEAEFSHGICPDCAKILYPDFNFSD
jgi:two-component system sensor histidine kinase EvgS